MFRHLLKLIWKRKARNLMLSLEILIAFLIVFGIAAFAVRSAQLYRLPTGFVPDNIWSVLIVPVEEGNDKFDDGVYDRLKRTLEALPEVKQVAFATVAPYQRGGMSGNVAGPDGTRAHPDMLEVSDDFFTLLGVPLTQGRAFDRSDDGAPALPVVVNRRFAEQMFSGQNAIGKVFDGAGPGSKEPSPMKVVGLIEDLRKTGELGSPQSVLIFRYTPNSTRSAMQTILIKMQPGVERAFEETLSARLKSLNNGWSYEITPLSAARRAMLKNETMPLIILSVIAGFLLLMVAFGLFGVLWQNTTRRIPEIGLRRAVGASAAQIYRQIIAEQFLLSSGAMLVGLFLLVQLPLTGALGESLNWVVFGAAALLSMTLIYLLSLLCSVYPGWRASRLSPTEALHYE